MVSLWTVGNWPEPLWKQTKGQKSGVPEFFPGITQRSAFVLQNTGHCSGSTDQVYTVIGIRIPQKNTQKPIRIIWMAFHTSCIIWEQGYFLWSGPPDWLQAINHPSPSEENLSILYLFIKIFQVSWPDSCGRDPLFKKGGSHKNPLYKGNEASRSLVRCVLITYLPGQAKYCDRSAAKEVPLWDPAV